MVLKPEECLCEAENDEDILSVNTIFDGNYQHIAEKAVTEENKDSSDYCLHITTTLSSSLAAVSSTNGVVSIVSVGQNRLTVTDKITSNVGEIVDLKCNPNDDNLLYLAGSSGIDIIDFRTPLKPVNRIVDSTIADTATRRTFTCFDSSQNDRLISAGTELFKGDAFILFWDNRYSKLLGGYWETHTDDITQIKFHPQDSNKFISGSTDGLINIYDLTQTSEDDALVDSLNTDSSIEQLSWFNNNSIYCSTHTHEIQLWKLEDSQPFMHIRRHDIAKNMKRKCMKHSYVVGAHNLNNNLLYISGSNYNDGECLRSFKIVRNSSMPAFNFKENKQRVRCSTYNENKSLLMTTGEKGLVNIWKLLS